MYLKEIKISGFKSFADKTSLELSPHINVIVGPNGSGKSNIVDAISWALGEQSNRPLRASSSQDIIFSGSKFRKPLNSASVNLIFDNTDRHLPLEYNEISIKRVVFRSGEGEYYLNNERCRLKDILNLLLDSGSGRGSFNVISQGKIDEILSLRPEDRRAIFEEATGVLKYKKRKEETLRKIEKTNQNLTRINDIINEVNSTILPLKTESDKATQYTEYINKLTNLEIALITSDITNLYSESKLLKTSNSSINDELVSLQSLSLKLDSNIIQAKQKLQIIDEEINKYTSIVLNKTKELESSNTDIRLFEERRKNNNDNDENKVNTLKGEILKIKSKINSLNGDIKLELAKESEAEKLLNSYNNKYKENLNTLNKYKENIQRECRALSEIEFKINQIEEMLSSENYLPKAIKMVLNNSKFKGVHNILSNVISTKSEYSVAITTALGQSANNLIVSSKEEIKKIIKYLKDNNLGRITFYPLEDIKPRYIKDDIMNIIKAEKGFINIASSLVEVNKTYENIVKKELGGVIVCDNIDNANVIASKINYSYKIVTIDGDVVNSGGTITGGSRIKITSSTSLKYELDALNKEASFKKKSKDDLEEKYQALVKENNTVEYNTYDYNLNVSKHKTIISRLNKELEELTEKKSEYERELNVLNINEEEDVKTSLYKSYYALKDSLEESKNKLNILKVEKSSLNQNILDMEKESNSTITKIAKLEKDINNNEIKLNRLDVRIDDLLLSLNNTYNLTYSKAKENYHLDEDYDRARELTMLYKDKISELGSVNLKAPEEYKTHNERLLFLTSQRDDLLSSEKTMLEITDEMDKIMKERFMDTFNKIRGEFKEVFRDLFKGGNADIYLTNEEDILTSGIEIMAEPPGKKLQSISLLSGGEKTFTAISLLFAVLNVRPVPFCILDETEAALDEANVNSFGLYLEKYKNKTQFILITHKKKTMEFADTLYGITMKEAGVSSFVSVKLEDKN